ncbi:acyltransferase [Aporhodopirellula aestuarii]|uniref:Acyltransferase n=1 Tax=Aporhodopirellula aestuarii TaxID=2950107 RepID=A0ABT0U8B6_9BACT|nr:acyltransferase [Aporhodopirellula aestuarii]MCM2373162.1 acyltransferase [Aporhodopirellula aestuarii]
MNSGPSLHRRRSNDGFLLLEILLALTFLAVATGLTLKLHQSRLDFDRVSTERLADQLAIENLAETLSVVPYSEISAAASRLTEESDVQLDVEPFESGSAKGRHVLISIESASGPLTHHVWRLEATP